MPSTTNWIADGAHVRFIGDFGQHDIGSARAALSGDSRFGKARYFILDFSEVEYIDTKLEHINAWAANDVEKAHSNERIRGALVAGQRGARALAMCYIEASRRLQTPWNLRLFDTLMDARLWLYFGSNMSAKAQDLSVRMQPSGTPLPNA